MYLSVSLCVSVCERASERKKVWRKKVHFLSSANTSFFTQNICKSCRLLTCQLSEFLTCQQPDCESSVPHTMKILYWLLISQPSFISSFYSRLSNWSAYILVTTQLMGFADSSHAVETPPWRLKLAGAQSHVTVAKGKQPISGGQKGAVLLENTSWMKRQHYRTSPVYTESCACKQSSVLSSRANLTVHTLLTPFFLSLSFTLLHFVFLCH